MKRKRLSASGSVSRDTPLVDFDEELFNLSIFISDHIRQAGELPIHTAVSDALRQYFSPEGIPLYCKLSSSGQRSSHWQPLTWQRAPPVRKKRTEDSGVIALKSDVETTINSQCLHPKRTCLAWSEEGSCTLLIREPLTLNNAIENFRDKKGPLPPSKCSSSTSRAHVEREILQATNHVRRAFDETYFDWPCIRNNAEEIGLIAKLCRTGHTEGAASQPSLADALQFNVHCSERHTVASQLGCRYIFSHRALSRLRKTTEAYGRRAAHQILIREAEGRIRHALRRWDARLRTAEDEVVTRMQYLCKSKKQESSSEADARRGGDWSRVDCIAVLLKAKEAYERAAEKLTSNLMTSAQQNEKLAENSACPFSDQFCISLIPSNGDSHQSVSFVNQACVKLSLGVQRSRLHSHEYPVSSIASAHAEEACDHTESMAQFSREQMSGSRVDGSLGLSLSRHQQQSCTVEANENRLVTKGTQLRWNDLHCAVDKACGADTMQRADLRSASVQTEYSTLRGQAKQFAPISNVFRKRRRIEDTMADASEEMQRREGVDRQATSRSMLQQRSAKPMRSWYTVANTWLAGVSSAYDSTMIAKEGRFSRDNSSEVQQWYPTEQEWVSKSSRFVADSSYTSRPWYPTASIWSPSPEIRGAGSTEATADRIEETTQQSGILSTNQIARLRGKQAVKQETSEEDSSANSLSNPRHSTRTLPKRGGYARKGPAAPVLEIHF